MYTIQPATDRCPAPPAGLTDGSIPKRECIAYPHGFAENIVDGTLELTAYEVDAAVGTDDAPVIIVDDDLQVEVILITHGPAPTLAYRLSHGGRLITIATDLDST